MQVLQEDSSARLRALRSPCRTSAWDFLRPMHAYLGSCVDHWISCLASMIPWAWAFEPHLSPDRQWPLGAQRAGHGLTVGRAEGFISSCRCIDNQGSHVPPPERLPSEEIPRRQPNKPSAPKNEFSYVLWLDGLVNAALWPDQVWKFRSMPRISPRSCRRETVGHLLAEGTVAPDSRRKNSSRHQAAWSLLGEMRRAREF